MNNKTTIILSLALLLATSCKEKQEEKDIIVPTPEEQTEKKETLEMKETRQNYTETWNGKKYTISIVRSPDHSLPLTYDEMQNEYYDNIITVRIQREDGSDLLNKTYRKSDFKDYTSGSGMEKTGALLGIVYDAIEGNNLSFAASVGSPDPNSDEYIPLRLTVSPSGSVKISPDTKMDVTGDDLLDDEGV